MAFRVSDPSKSRKCPKTLIVGIACSLSRRGALVVRCRTRPSRSAVVGVAGRDCFGLGKRGDKSILGRAL